MHQVSQKICQVGIHLSTAFTVLVILTMVMLGGLLFIGSSGYGLYKAYQDVSYSDRRSSEMQSSTASTPNRNSEKTPILIHVGDE